MSSESMNLFVSKRHALPAYEPAPDILSPLERFKRCLGKILSWLFDWLFRRPSLVDAESVPLGERVDVLIASPPQVYGPATLFQSDPNHDLAAVRASREAVAEYRRTYKEREGYPYPFRYHLARHSGVPSFLNGYLDQTDQPGLEGIAFSWLGRAGISEALFGVNWSEAVPRLQYVESVLVPLSNKTGRSDSKESQVRAHSRFQQLVDGLPVFGAQVVTHIRQGDPRISCTSSYFPLLSSVKFRRPNNLEQARRDAKQRAIKAVANELSNVEAIGLYLKLLTDDELRRPAWTDWYTEIAFALIKALSQRHPDQFRSLAALPRTTPAINLLRILQEYSKSLDEYRWNVGILPYAGSELFVYPFAGHYYLAYLIELTPPNAEPPWRVFVDVNEGFVLGTPEQSVLHADYFPTSHDTLMGVTAPLNQTPPSLQQEVEHDNPFMSLQHFDAQGRLVHLDLAHPPDAQYLLEGVNIAFHARALFRCFEDPNDLGILFLDQGQQISASDKIKQNSPVQVIVGKGGNDYHMGFTKTDQPPKGQITFQTVSPGNQNHLNDTDNRVPPVQHPAVFAPSLDREIIVHEFAHAFMWKLRFDPAFGMQESERPFIFPLLEGYATFFARSLAVRDDFDLNDPDGLLWARAAYRKGDWDTMWAPNRTGSKPGADIFPWPNIYPQAQANGKQAYEVSMLWVRALWDIAWLLADPPVPPNTPGNVSQPNRTSAFKTANRLALNSYFYLHGLTANYELAAEGIVDSADGLNTPPIQENLKQALGKRGIYAECGVQALAESPSFVSRLFVGSDQGVALWDKQQASPLVPWNLPDGSDIAALQADAGSLYAASESAIWKTPSGGGTPVWSKVEGATSDPTRDQFPSDQLPLSIAVLNGNVIVGTSDGLWTFSNDWQALTSGRMAMSMTLVDWPGVANQAILVATLTEYVYLVTPIAGASFEVKTVVLANSAARATSAVLFNGALYVGTVDGVERQADFQNNVSTNRGWSSETVGGKGVMCLVVDHTNNRVGAGTTLGLYWRDANGTWRPDTTIHSDAQTAIIRCVSWGNHPAIGTFGQGIFVFDNGAWNKQPI